MEASHILADANSDWIDVRDIHHFIGQQFTAGHTGNKDLEKIEFTGRVFGSSLDDIANSSLVSFSPPLPSLWTYYGTNNFGSDRANFLSGNSGVYADYQESCRIKDGQHFSLTMTVLEFISASGDVSFDVVVTNVGGSQVVTFPVHVYDALTAPEFVLRVIATEDWSTYKIEFDNFSWNGTGSVAIQEVDMVVKTSVLSWAINNVTRLTTKMYDDINTVLNAVCDDYSASLFPADDGNLLTMDNLEVLVDMAQYAMVAARDYRTTTDIQDLQHLVNQLEALSVPVLTDLATPQVQSTIVAPENLVAGAPWNITDTFGLNPDRASSVFAGQVRREGELVKSDLISVTAGSDYTFRARVRIPSTGGATTYTISVNNENDGSVIAFRTQALVDQVPDYFFEEEFTVSVPSDTSTVYFKVDVTVAVPSLYVDGVMLTKDADGTPLKYHYSTGVGAPASVALLLASTEADTMYEWDSGDWVGITFNSLITTVWVGDTTSELPIVPPDPISDLLAGLSWPIDVCDQPSVMESLLSTIQSESDLLLQSLRPIIQVNKPTKPVFADWISAYKKSGGVGSIPDNGSYRWSDSGQSDKEYTSEFVVLQLESGDTQPISENGTALFGSTSFIPFNKTLVTKSAPVSGDGWSVVFDLIRDGYMDVRFFLSSTSIAETLTFYLNEVLTPSGDISVSIPTAVIVAYLMGLYREIITVGQVSAGYGVDAFWETSGPGPTSKLFDYSIMAAIDAPDQAYIPLSQIEVHHV